MHAALGAPLYFMRTQSLRTFVIIAYAFGIALLSTGCASVARGTKDKLKVVSEPPGAQVSLSNGQTGTTPATFKLPRKKGVVVEVSKEGYEPQKVVVSSKFSGAGGTALAGNVLIGGLIGTGIDGLSGATLSLKPNPVSVTLIPIAPPAAGEAALSAAELVPETITTDVGEFPPAAGSKTAGSSDAVET